MLKLAALVGPTAVGKTELSIKLAQEINGEIISCDSMQVYKGMNIGTAKATEDEQVAIPHHLISIINPCKSFTVADYQKLARDKIQEISANGKIPLLVGGTGLYYQAVVDDYQFFPMDSIMPVRKKWENTCSINGLEYLYKKLLEIDKEYAIKIGRNDKKRIIHALEVYDITGRPFSEFQQKKTDKYHLAPIGLFMERDVLYNRIEERVMKMLDNGLIDEVYSLREKGCTLAHNSMQALGYKQVYYYLEGMMTRDEMIDMIKKETRRFAKRQYTWFNKDKRIVWINIAEYPDGNDLLKKIHTTMEGLLYIV